MGAVKSLVVLTAGAAMGVAALIAYRISQEEGKSLQEALSDVPTEMERLYDELKAKGVEALEKGRAAYESKQQPMGQTSKGMARSSSSRPLEVLDIVQPVLLSVPRGALAVSAMRVVVGWVGSRNDVSLEHLDDVNLALETLVAGDAGQDDVLRLRVWVESGAMHLMLEDLRSRDMLANLEATGEPCLSTRWPLDIRLFLRALVDDYVVVRGEGESFGVSMCKGIC